MLQFAFKTVYNQPNLLANNDHDELPRGVQTHSHDRSRKQFKMFRPAKVLVEKSISFLLRKSWNSLPTLVHQFEDKHALASFLLANSVYLNF